MRFRILCFLCVLLFPFASLHAGDELVILVQDDLEPAIESYVSFKKAEGYEIRIHRASRIQADGRDRAEEIRNWLVDRYGDGSFRYLLLVGSFETFPMRLCQVTPDRDFGNINPNRRRLPKKGLFVQSDLYYADLTGTWDKDGDGRFGEYGQDAPDFDPEFGWGRIPFGTRAEVRDALDRVLQAQKTSGAWRKRCLLLGATIILPGDGQTAAQTIAASHLEPEGWEVERLYPADQPIRGDGILRKGAVQKALKKNPGSAILSVSHGSTTGLGSQNTKGYEVFLGLDDLTRFPEGRPPLLVAFSCNAGRPFLPNGKFAFGARSLKTSMAGFLGATIVVHPLSGRGAGMEAEFTLAKELMQGQPLGKVMRITLTDYAKKGLERTETVKERSSVWRHAMSGVLYGDPTMRLGGRVPETEEPQGKRRAF